MKVTFKDIKQPGSVFSDMPSPSYNKFYETKPLPADKLELSSIKTKAFKNKKYIIGAAVGLTALAALTALTFLKRKNLSGIPVKEMEKTAQNIKNTAEKAENITGRMEMLIKNAENILMDDVNMPGPVGTNSICFYGPESLGKEKAIDGFLTTMQQKGFAIEKAPRIKNHSTKEISAAITNLTKKAENRYNLEKQRSLILVRDLDQLAPERTKKGVTETIRVLMDKMDGCSKKGYAFITEAVNFQEIDVAVTRPGRTNHTILARPLAEESMDVWNKYVDVIKSMKDSPKKTIFMEEAAKIIKEKGI